MQVLKLGMSVIYKRKSFEIPAFWGHHALSDWTLFRGEDNPPPVPDRGATEMLLGTALGALGMARRFLKS